MDLSTDNGDGQRNNLIKDGKSFERVSMTEDDKYFLKEFLTSVFTTGSVFIVFIVILVVFINVSEPLESSFEVVDKYKECDVVRYAPHQVAEYKYFLYCEKNK